MFKDTQVALVATEGNWISVPNKTLNILDLIKLKNSHVSQKRLMVNNCSGIYQRYTLSLSTVNSIDSCNWIIIPKIILNILDLIKLHKPTCFSEEVTSLN